MMRHKQIEPRFVKGIPRDLEPGVLYVSMEYATVVHSCCCGCGHEVVTPLTPTDWMLTYNGEAISLAPSVGNWNLPCQSHYVIRDNRVIEMGRWNKRQIEAEQRRDKAAKAEHYARLTKPAQSPLVEAAGRNPISVEARGGEKGFWEKLRLWLFQ
jgi:hypothetical protein